MIKWTLSGFLLASIGLPASGTAVGPDSSAAPTCCLSHRQSVEQAATVPAPAELAITFLGMAGFAAFALIRRDRRSKH